MAFWKRPKIEIKSRESKIITLNDIYKFGAGSLPATDLSYINNGYLTNSNVYSVINLITRSASALGWEVFVVKDEKAMRKYKKYSGQARIDYRQEAKYYRSKALELATESDLQGVLDHPNEVQGIAEFIENWLGFKLLTGNGYAHGVRGTNKWSELWVLPSQHVEIVPESNSYESGIKGFKLQGMSELIPPEDVMHSKFWTPDYSAQGSHLYGLSPLRAALEVLESSNSAYKANQRAFKNMGAEGMLTLDDDGITEEQANSLREDLRKRSSGPDNFKKILVNTAKWRWIHFGLSPTDLNLIEAQKWNLRDIANIFGVSTELLNDPDTKTMANKQEARKGLYYEAVFPNIDPIKWELNYHLARQHSKVDGVEYFIDYDISGVPALAEDMLKVAEKFRNSPWLTPNEARAEMGYEELDDEWANTPQGQTRGLGDLMREFGQ